MYIIAEMLKKLVLSSALAVFAIFAVPALVSAQTQTCTQVYGGGVVCGAAVPEHKPIETGLGDNLVVLGGAFVLASGALLYFSRRIRGNSSNIIR